MKINNENGFVIFNHLSKDYKGFRALDNISFMVEKGDVLGYVGPNGAGKTTTIKSMVGLISDYQGSITIGGKKLPGENHQVHKKIGYLPQNLAFQEWRTVEHALETFGLLSGIEKAELDSKIQSTLEIVGLAEFRHKKIIELSGGNIQKVGLAQALLHEPQLLILDEPLAGLDPASRHNVKQIIKKLSKKGITIFFSSHILSDVQDVATKIAIISRGRLMKYGSLGDLKAEFSSPNIIEIDPVSEVGFLEPYKDIEGIVHMEYRENGKIQVTMDPNQDPTKISNQIIKRLLDSNQSIRGFGPVDPNLDELYIKYVTRGVAQ